MTLSLGRAENDPAPANAGCGTCVLPAGSDAAIGDYCRGPRVDVPGAGRRQRDDGHTAVDRLPGGSPHDSIDPHQVTGILWLFHDPPAPDGGTGNDGGTDAPMRDRRRQRQRRRPVQRRRRHVRGGSARRPTAGASDASTGPGYNADITIDDITLVPF